MPISLQVNGKQHDVDVPPDTPLLWVIRDVIGLTGTKYGCGIAACGACTVHVGGEAVRSCVTAVGDVADAGDDDRGPRPGQATIPVQRAWRDAQRAPVRLLPVRPDHAGGRVPGLDQESRPTSRSPRPWPGNICRCGCYQRIHAAVKSAGTGA